MIYRLIGYIKEVFKNSFSIPIYCNDNKYYCHSLNDNFTIKEFYETQISDDSLIVFNTYKNFSVNDIAPIVFIGINNVLFFDSVDLVIDRLTNYIKETTDSDKYLLTKEEIFSLKKNISYQSTIEEQLYPNSRVQYKILNNVRKSKIIYFDRFETDRLAKGRSIKLNILNHIISIKSPGASFTVLKSIQSKEKNRVVRASTLRGRKKK